MFCKGIHGSPNEFMKGKIQKVFYGRSIHKNKFRNRIDYESLAL